MGIRSGVRSLNTVKLSQHTSPTIEKELDFFAKTPPVRGEYAQLEISRTEFLKLWGTLHNLILHRPVRHSNWIPLAALPDGTEVAIDFTDTMLNDFIDDYNPEWFDLSIRFPKEGVVLALDIDGEDRNDADFQPMLLLYGGQDDSGATGDLTPLLAERLVDILSGITAGSPEYRLP